MAFSALLGCIWGQLHYITPSSKHQTACQTEYSGQLSVDYYAVAYILSYCVTEAIKQGNRGWEQLLPL